MLAILRMSCSLCLVALFCTAALADEDSVAVSRWENWPEVQGRTKIALLTAGATSSRKATREPYEIPAVSIKWAELQSRIAADEEAISACRSDASTCREAVRRFLSIVELAQGYEGRARLGIINRATNMAIKPADDPVQYGESDYWASPLQTLGSGAGDCEDYAIVKYAVLRALGFNSEDLRLVIVQDARRTGEHAVLAVRYTQQWLLLDNRTMVIANANDVHNYSFLYALDSNPNAGTRVADRHLSETSSHQ